MILDKVYKAFFHSKDFVNWAYKPHLTHTLLLSLEIEFERGLYLHGEGYNTDPNYDLPQLLQRTTHIYVVPSTTKASFDPLSSQRGTASILLSTPTGRVAGSPFYKTAQKCLNFNNMPLPIMECDNVDEEEEYFPKAPLDDAVWSGELIPERDLYIHMAPKKSEASYTTQTTAYPEGPYHEAAPREVPLDSMFGDRPNVTDIPKEVLI